MQRAYKDKLSILWSWEGEEFCTEKVILKMPLKGE